MKNKTKTQLEYLGIGALFEVADVHDPVTPDSHPESVGVVLGFDDPSVAAQFIAEMKAFIEVQKRQREKEKTDERAQREDSSGKPADSPAVPAGP